MTDACQPINSDAPPIKSALLSDCIYRIGRVMERIDDQAQLLRAILEECRQLLDCEAASVALYDVEAGDLEFTAVSGGAGDQLKVFRIPLDKGIIGKVAQKRKPIISNDCHKDPNWCDQVETESGFTTRNIAAVPMLHLGKLIGVLEILNRQDDGDFDRRDLQLLQVFADQAEIAIHTQRLIDAKKESERLAGFGIALADIGHSVKNILMRMKAPIGVIDMVHEQQAWNMFNQPWEIMKRAINEITDLVLDMLRYAKPRKPSVEPTDIYSLVNEVVETCCESAQSAGIELFISSPKDVMEWPVDRQVLHYALHNLIGNAIDAIAGADIESASITIDLQCNEKALSISIADGSGHPRGYSK